MLPIFIENNSAAKCYCYMAMDFIAAKSKKESLNSSKFYALEENLHGAIFLVAQSKVEFPVLWQIQDYYADGIFLYGELSLLKKELQRITQMGMKKTPALDTLLYFIDQAIQDQNNIYVLAD